MGKSSINGPFSMAMLVITRGYIESVDPWLGEFLELALR